MPWLQLVAPVWWLLGPASQQLLGVTSCSLSDAFGTAGYSAGCILVGAIGLLRLGAAGLEHQWFLGCVQWSILRGVFSLQLCYLSLLSSGSPWACTGVGRDTVFVEFLLDMPCARLSYL